MKEKEYLPIIEEDTTNKLFKIIGKNGNMNIVRIINFKQCMDVKQKVINFIKADLSSIKEAMEFDGTFFVIDDQTYFIPEDIGGKVEEIEGEISRLIKKPIDKTRGNPNKEEKTYISNKD